MKRQIRMGLFETNSSSTHTITMMLKSDYDKWVNRSDMYMYNRNYSFAYENVENKPVKNHVYTRDEVLAFIRSSKYHDDKSEKYLQEAMNDEYELNEYLRDCNFIPGDYENEYLEYYEEEFTTPGGEAVVAFGYYGYDG